ncbi:hypothetical protein phytr_1240 [Candidatus Phycorickettsia trachydisci]|uniref:Uncharacterized protein n=1 Tax=Candidatus Phycorickettsia trachydisci TaxID=2115978 RepID=A0A2P1P731_9RICK|nr:hypothetical protein [Candidatus Phycorickettsia trachydisci]AVP87084.1 hypothetical protein phytr_1240 [Candidatus Phycorickettsia trachydisci]
MLRIILLIYSFISPIIADEAKDNSFLDTGGVQLPKISTVLQNPDDASQNSNKNLIVPIVPNKPDVTSNTIPSAPSAISTSDIKPDSAKIENSKTPTSPKVSEVSKDKIQETVKPSPSVPSIDTQTASSPPVKLPIPDEPKIKPESQVTTASKPDIQDTPVVKPSVPALPPPGPRQKATLNIPTLPPPGPKTNIPNTSLPKAEMAQQAPSIKREVVDVSKQPVIASNLPSQNPIGVSNNQGIDKVQTGVSTVSQNIQKPETSQIGPIKTPIQKPSGWTLQDRIKGYSIVKKPIQSKKVPYTFEPNQIQTAKAKKPIWSFKRIWSFKKGKTEQTDISDDQKKKKFEVKNIWSFKKKKESQATQHAKNNTFSKKPIWSFKRLWSFKKKGQQKSLDPIDLTPMEIEISQAKVPEKDIKKPAYVIKPKKIQLASHTKAYSIKEKNHDLREKQVLDFEEQELKIIKAKDYDDSLDRLSYSKYVKLFWSKFSTKREKEKAVDIKGYLDNYYKYHLDKKIKRRN